MRTPLEPGIWLAPLAHLIIKTGTPHASNLEAIDALDLRPFVDAKEEIS
jgi:hypothetical protein